MHARRKVLHVVVMLSYKAFVAALRDVKSSLPNEDFVAHVEKLRALQHRIQAVSDRLAIVEARPILHVVLQSFALHMLILCCYHDL